MKAVILVLGMFTCLAGCESTSVQLQEEPKVIEIDESHYEVVFPAENSVRFLGKQSHQGEGDDQAGGVMYPGYNAGSFLAGVLVHALVQSGANAAKESNAEKEANKVLSSYESAIEDISPEWLMSEPLKVSVLSGGTILFSPNHSAEVKDVVHCTASVAPTFLLTQNQKSLILDNSIELVVPNPNVLASPSARSVRVFYVESPTAPDPYDYWAGNNYENLRTATREMFLESLKLAALHGIGTEKEIQKKAKTVRFLEGGKKKVERGVVLDSSCERLTFLSLRGAIKSVPRSSSKCKIPAT